jgi:hypothetical protein
MWGASLGRAWTSFRNGRRPSGREETDSLMHALALIARVVVAVLLAVALTAATTKGCNLVSAPNSSHVFFGLVILAVSWAIAIAYITWLYIGIAKWANRAKWEGPK